MIVFVFLLDFLFSAFHFCASALCQCHWASGCVCEVQTPDSQVHRDREIINLITNWDCIFLVIHFVLFMLRIVTNHLVTLASATSQLPLREQRALRFQRYV